MTRRPIHRWKTLWLGIFVLISLAWAWHRTLDRISEVMVNVPGHGMFALGQFNGELSLFHDTSSAAHSWHYRASSMPGAVDPAHLDAFREIYALIGVFHVSYAHLIIAFLLPWLTFLLWRWRRSRNLLDSSSQTPATP